MTKGFFDEHLFDWMRHMREIGYPVSGYVQTCMGGHIIERNFGTSVVNPEVVIRYDI